MRPVRSRLLRTVPTVLGITVLAFALVRAAPGSPAALYGDGGLQPGGATLLQLREYRRLMGLDEPVLAGYLRWMSQLLRGDLGSSFRDGRPVLTVLAEALPVTLLLSLPSLLLGYLVAIPIGIVSAARPGGVLDRALGWFVFALFSLPLQWVALVLVLFAGDAGWPIQGLHGEGMRTFPDLLAHLILPVACLTYGSVAVLSRYLRSSMLEEMGQDYVRTARAKGLRESAVILRHVLPNSLLSLLTLFGLTLPALISGAVILERVFGLPGMGRLTFDAALGRDLPVLMGVITLSGILTTLGMAAADALYARADPRIRLETEQA
ncbi:MAG TPA: ABC transporter permease [Myxococcales bacterium]|jgi:peptide/nickel transport system permease protein|nr:ABC transporter permease [Myxococcales bacterium]